MRTKQCRLCGAALPLRPLVSLKGMPKSAQFLPDRQTLRNDAGIDLKVLECGACGLVQLANPPVSYYREVIRASAFSPEMRKFRLKQFASFVKAYSLKGKSMFEPGCGRGEYLGLARQCGVKPYGMEYSADSVKSCLKNGLVVTKGFISRPTQKIAGAPFHSFFTFNFLEHLADPCSFLTGIRNNLSAGAVGIIEVPNSGKILKGKLVSEFIVDHQTYFTKETFLLALKYNGFVVKDCSEVWHGNNLSAVVSPRSPLNASGYAAQAAALREEISVFNGLFEKVAVWGASHQSLTVLSMLGNTARIKYIIDSAAFKQNKYSPVTHIPIVGPEFLRRHPVDAIIVMAAGYSDEVAAGIRAEFSSSMPLAILRDNGRLEILKGARPRTK